MLQSSTTWTVQRWPESVIKTDPAPTEPHRHLLDTGKLGGRRVAEVGEVRVGRLLSLCVIPPEGSFWPSSFLLFIPLLHYHPLISLKLRSPRDPPAPCTLRSQAMSSSLALLLQKLPRGINHPNMSSLLTPCIVELKLSIVSPSTVSSTPSPPLADSPVAFYFSTFPLLFSCPKDTQKRCFCITPPKKGIFHSKKPKRSWKWSCTRFFLCLWQAQ